MNTKLTHALVLSFALAACSRNGEPLLTPPPAVSDQAPTPSAAAPTAQNAPARIHASHILVMHNGSERKPPNVNRNLSEARNIAQQLLVRARNGEDFAALARQNSDEPNHEEKAGDLGFFTRENMVAPFSDAAFRLPVGGISDVVQTPFGFHIIKRLE